MNTLRFSAVLGIILCLVVSPVIALMSADTVQAQPADSAWPMFGQNPQRTGRSPYSGPEVPQLKWSFTTGDRVTSSPAIGADGTIYVGSYDHNLYAINPDGTQKWSFTTGDRVTSSPATGADGTIYVGSLDRVFYAINPDGSRKWSFTTGDRVTSSPAIGADGTIYVGSYDHNLYAINPDGSLKWAFTTGREVYSSPDIGADGTIYVGSNDGNLYGINPDGTQKWTFTCGVLGSSPAIGADGTIYVGSYDHNLYAITEEEKEYDLTISSTAGGSVFDPGEGTFTYVEGTGVTLVAEAEEGYRFINWTGDVYTIADIEDATTTIAMDGDYSITANFEEEPSEPSGGRCFIATAAYGSPMATEIGILREFRDEYLLTNPLGQALIDLYYRVSPPIAQFITEHPSLKPIVRAGLLPAVGLSTVVVDTSPAEKIAIIGLLVLGSVAVAVWAKTRQGRDPKYA
jgi:outer membrane protein assembly factor BamB